MKQQKQPATQPRAQADWPDQPEMPIPKTIGGDADKTAFLNHRNSMNSWYYDLKTKLNQQIDELNGEIRDLQARVSDLEKNALP